MNFFSLFKRQLIYNFKKKTSIDSDDINSNKIDPLFHHYGSDKANIFKGTQKQGHGYSKFYEQKLDIYKEKKINILEIGSFAGSSAAAFVKYFPKSNVFCFDVNISNFSYMSKNIHVFGIDIKNEKKVIKTLNKIFSIHQFNEFDIIIDDGSHNLSDILVSLKFFFKFTKKKGFFIIEDFKHPNYYEYNKNIDHILIDEFLRNLGNKKISPSSIIDSYEQVELMNSINKIEIFKGNLKDSDISFISKN